MSTPAASAPVPPWRALPLPREHGFWALSCAIALSSALTRPGWAAGFAAVGSVGAAAVVGGSLRSRIRRDATLQLGSVLVLATLAVPIELVAGRHARDALLDAAAWASVACGFSLGVWASTARSSRVRRSQAGVLTLLSVLVPALATVCFAFGGWYARAMAALLAAAATLGFAIWRPGSKQMKRVGMSLGGCAAVVGIVLAFG